MNNSFQKSVISRLDIRTVTSMELFEAVKVTEDNFLDAARWAWRSKDTDNDGRLLEFRDNGFFRLPDNDEFPRAFHAGIGHWIIKDIHDKGVHIVDDVCYEKLFKDLSE
jgi:hypothetical protein